MPRRHVVPFLALVLTAACDGSATGPAARTAADSVLSLTNEARAEAGVPALLRSMDLDEVAQAHAEDMALRGYFSHTAPDGTTFSQRLAAAGIGYRTAGENIAGNASAAGAVTAWLGSSGHRDNLLNPAFGKLGVGIHREADSPWTYYVQVFTN